MRRHIGMTRASTLASKWETEYLKRKSKPEKYLPSEIEQAKVAMEYNQELLLQYVPKKKQ